LYLTSGKNGYSTLFKGSPAENCIILTSALQDDNTYIITSDFNTSNVTMKANKVTIVNNAKVIGSDINGSTTAKGTETLTADIGILSGRTNSAYVYSSKHKIFWIKFYDKSNNLMHEFNFSEGAGQQTFDVVTGNAYDISNINPNDFWNYKQDYNHYNFRYGFTLYQKTGAADIRIPNKKDQSEIVPVSVPSGYSRVANYKECRQTFNQCENVFKLNNTTVATVLRCATAGTADAIGDYVYNSTNSRWVNTTTGAYIYLQGGTEWYWKDAANILLYYGYASTSPANVVTWFRSGGAEPAPSQLQSVLITSDLYNADPDFVLFTENTGVAKEINIGTLDVNIGIDRGYLYINPNIQEHDFMLYGTDKTLKDDEKIIKYIGLGDEIVYTSVTQQDGSVIDEVTYDENDHTILE